MRWRTARRSRYAHPDGGSRLGCSSVRYRRSSRRYWLIRRRTGGRRAADPFRGLAHPTGSTAGHSLVGQRPPSARDERWSRALWPGVGQRPPSARDERWSLGDDQIPMACQRSGTALSQPSNRSPGAKPRGGCTSRPSAAMRSSVGRWGSALTRRARDPSGSP